MDGDRTDLVSAVSEGPRPAVALPPAHWRSLHASSLSGLPSTVVAVACGIVLGVVYSASPLTIWAAGGVVALIWYAARDLPPAERRRVQLLLGAAFALRVLVVAGLFLASPHDDQAAGVLFGDEAYALERAWRARAIRIGLPLSKYDYAVAFDDYGRTSYITAIAFIEWLVGPSPYGLRLLNAMLYLASAVILFRLVRRGFGSTIATGALGVLLYLPTLFVWSISLLKESLYLALTSVVFAAGIELVRATTWTRRIGWPIAAMLALWAARDVRDGAVPLLAVSLALGWCLWAVTRTKRTALIGGAVALVFVVAALGSERGRAAVYKGLNAAAAAHAGHVFTVGHSYKLLDEPQYVFPSAMPRFDLSAPEAARFVLRAAASFVAVPVPWAMESRSELIYMPEELVWYSLILLAVIGIPFAFHSDHATASLLLGMILPTAAAVALTTGNVGTLIRHRTLVVPYLASLSLVGASVLVRRLMRDRQTAGWQT
jgi:hypothetical protein